MKGENISKEIDGALEGGGLGPYPDEFTKSHEDWHFRD